MKLWNDQEFQHIKENKVTNGNGGFYQQEWMASLNGWMLLICLFWGSWSCFPLILHRVLLFWALQLFIDPIRGQAFWGSLDRSPLGLCTTTRVSMVQYTEVDVARISCPNGPSVFLYVHIYMNVFIHIMTMIMMIIIMNFETWVLLIDGLQVQIALW